VRAGLILDVFSARQGGEDDEISLLCLGGKVIGSGIALVVIGISLHAQFSEAPRDQRRLAKVKALETGIENHDDQHPHT
jgi:ribose 5-phosphate isomerase B